MSCFCQNVAYTLILLVLLGLFSRRILYFQESLIYEDVSVDFTWEEWMQLCSAQRNLYGRVMLENWSTLVSLGEQPHLQPSAYGIHRFDSKTPSHGTSFRIVP